MLMITWRRLAPAVGVAFLAKAQVVKAGRRQIFARADLFAEDSAGKRRQVATGETLLMPATIREGRDPPTALMVTAK